MRTFGICPVCGKTFRIEPMHSLTDYNGKKVCSPHCSNIAYITEINALRNRRAQIIRQHEAYRKGEKFEWLLDFSHDKTDNDSRLVYKPVNVYDKNGNMLGELSSVYEAAEKLGYNVSSIRNAIASGTVLREQFVLRYQHTKRKSRPVLQYTKTGELVARYESCNQAGRAVGGTGSNVGLCCIGKIKSYKKFIFKFDD